MSNQSDDLKDEFNLPEEDENKSDFRTEQGFASPSPIDTGVSALEILRIQKGDTLLIRADATTNEQVGFILQAVGRLLLNQNFTTEDVHLLIVPSNIDIKRLNADQMKRQGWIRAGKIELARGNGDVNFPGPQPR
jgi:hypothetical protein